MNEPRYPLLTLSRLRLMTDGEGITTLVAGAGCPLNCKYCINGDLLSKAKPRFVTPQELYDLVRQDDLYFRATGGGITFGGGESLLHAEFIAAFRELIGEKWRICVETSLQISPQQLLLALSAVDEFIVDIKDLNPEIYRNYTGGELTPVLENLKCLLHHEDEKKIKLRIPLIPNFNTPTDCDRSEAQLRSLGAKSIERFDYVIR